MSIYLHNHILWAGKSQANVLEYLYPVATRGHCSGNFKNVHESQIRKTMLGTS